MNAALYFLCLVLLLPIAAMATLGLLVDSLANFGLWEVFKTLAAPLYDPLCKGIRFVLLFLGLFGLGGAGFIPAARPFGFGAIAVIGILCGALVVKVYPNDWGFGSVLPLIPGMVSIGISIYCVVRPQCRERVPRQFR